MAFDAAVLSVIIALIRRGSVSGLADLFDRVRFFWLLVVPFVITIGWFAIMGLPQSVKGPIGGAMHIVATLSFIAFFALNLKFPGMLFLMLGQMLNVLPIAANAGRMPVSSRAYMIACGETMKGDMMRHMVLTNSTRFNFLADIIPIPRLWRIPGGVISPGDFLVAVGLFMLIQYAMCSLRKPQSGVADAA